MSAIEPWTEGITVIAGMVYEDNGEVWRCRFSHLATAPCRPGPQTQDLWDHVKNKTP